MYMKKKKILIFEDEWPTIRGSFEMANIYAFEGILDFGVKAKSQDASFDDWSNQYLAVFVDITLAKNTRLDGYSILKKIKEENLMSLDRVFVLTGNSKLPDKLKEIGLNPKNFQIIYKPLGFDELVKYLRVIVHE